MAEIIVDGIDELFRRLDNAAAIDTLRPPMQRGVYRLQAAMAKYPPARPGSSYVRTGTLGRRWTTKVDETGDGLIGKIGNNTSYGPFVQSSAFQSRIHAGRWQTDEMVIKQEESAIVADFERAINEVLR